MFKNLSPDALGIIGRQGEMLEITLTHRFKGLEIDIGEVVKRAAAAVKGLGRTPNLRVTNGGLDANWMVKHGVPTVTFGAGQNEIHTVKEFVDLTEFESGCRLALTLATMD